MTLAAPGQVRSASREERLPDPASAYHPVNACASRMLAIAD
jgi:hypothetical protein